MPEDVKSSSQKITLEHIIISLQKSFSRVSATGGQIPKEQSRARIVGNVNFTIKLNLEPGEDDHLMFDNHGSIELQLAGEIDTDIRPIRIGEESDLSRPLNEE